MSERKFFVWDFNDDAGWIMSGPYSSEVEARGVAKTILEDRAEADEDFPEDAVGAEAYITEVVGHMKIESITKSKTTVNIKETP